MRLLASLTALAVILFSAISVSSDSSAGKTGTETETVASEYLSDGMYKDFDDSNAAVAAAAIGDRLTLNCTSAILMEKSTKTVLYEYNCDEVRAPASITKIMTMLLVMEAIRDGKLDTDDIVTASSHARGKGGSQIWLEDGEQMTVNELLKAVAVGSANDAATALAEHIAGSEEAFAVMMNERAKSLGMTNTHFVNCCGLDTDGHVTSARDIAVMSCELLGFDMIKQYSQIWIDYLRGDKTQLVNTNKLVRFYNGCTGLKTGTTDAAGFCVSASAERDGMELVAVVLDGKTSDLRFSDAKALLNYGFANYSLFEVPKDLILDPIKVTHGMANEIYCECEKTGFFVIPKGRDSSVTLNTVLSEEIEAPVENGQTVGKTEYILDGEILGESRIYAANPVERITFFKAFLRLLSGIIQL